MCPALPQLLMAKNIPADKQRTDGSAGRRGAQARKMRQERRLQMTVDGLNLQSSRTLIQASGNYAEARCSSGGAAGDSQDGEHAHATSGKLGSSPTCLSFPARGASEATGGRVSQSNYSVTKKCFDDAP